MNFKKLELLGLLVFTSIFSCAQTKTKELESLFSYCYENDLFNGNVLVFEKGKVIYKKSLGFADVEKKIYLDSNSQFRLASITKPLTALAVLKLSEDKKLSLEDPITKHLKNLPRFAKKIRIVHLLNHTSGIPPDYHLFNPFPKGGLHNKHFLHFFKKLKKLSFEPGHQYSYSNCGYILLSLIIEAASGKSYSEYLQEKIFNPLNMSNTVAFTKGKNIIKNQVKSYGMFGQEYIEQTFSTGAGTIFSTTQDLFNWLSTMFDEQVVKNITLRPSFQLTKLNNSDISSYGLGWNLDSTSSYITHAGFGSGFRTFAALDTSSNTGWIFLMNNGNQFVSNELMWSIKYIMEGKPYLVPKIPFSKIPEITFRNFVETIDSAKNEFIHNPKKYYLDEPELVNTSQHLLQKGDTNSFLILQNTFLQLDTSSSMLNNSLGKFYLEKGDHSMAIKHLTKALKLNPYNKLALENIAKIAPEYVVDTTQTPPVFETEMLQFTGTYKMPNNNIISITSEENQLYFKPEGYSKVPIYAVGINRFYCKKYYMEVKFEVNELFVLMNNTSRYYKIY